MRMRIPLALRGGESHIRALQERASYNRRTGYWYAVPSRANLRKRMWCGAIWMWKYASLSPRKHLVPRANLRQDLFQQNRPNGRLQSALLMGLRSGRVIHLSWAPQNSSWKSCTPGTRSIAPFMSILHSSCLRISAFRGNVSDCTMPLKQGSWRTYPFVIFFCSYSE